MASQGPLAPTTLVSTETGNEDWANPTNATPSDDAYATSSFTLFTSPFSDYLDVTAFPFSIPGGAVIDGIVVDIERHSDAGFTVFDVLVQLFQGGVASGDNKASGSPYPGSDTVETYGGPADTWGLSWSAADINSALFGVRVQAFNPNFDVIPDSAYIDAITITVYFTASAGAAPLPLLGVGG